MNVFATARSACPTPVAVATMTSQSPDSPSNNRADSTPESASPSATIPAQGAPRSLEFGVLAGSEREVLITHHGQIYRLLLTRNDKLILQK